MMNQVLLFLLDVTLLPFAALLLLRFHLQWMRAPLRNPVGDFVMVLTDFLVLRTRRYIPSVKGYDSATLLLALLAESLYLGLVLWIGLGSSFSPFGLLLFAAIKLLSISVYLLMGALILQAILSWINPYTPIAPLLNAITYRFLGPVRRIVPMIGGIDFSPMLLLIICQLLLMVPVAMLENFAARLL